MTNGAVSPPLLRRFSPRSFRGKFILVVGTAVLFDMLLGGGIALVPLKGGWLRIDAPTRDETGKVGDDLNRMLEQIDEPKLIARHTEGIENGNVKVPMPQIGREKIDDDITLLVLGAK